MTRDAHDVVRQIAEYAEAIAFQAGVGSSETAGQIVSFLWERPSLMPAFMAGTLSAVDSGMLDHHNGVLSWHGQDGDIHRPDPSKARFPAPAPEALLDRTAYDAIGSGVKALSWSSSMSHGGSVLVGRDPNGIEVARIYYDANREDVASPRIVAEQAAAQTNFERRVLSCPSTHTAAGAGPARCSSCDGTGDLIRADGEWLGWCPCGAAANAGAGPVGEAVAWQRRLSGPKVKDEGWHMVTQGVAAFALEHGHPEGLPDVTCEVRPLYSRPAEEPGEVERFDFNAHGLKVDIARETLRAETVEAALTETRERLEKALAYIEEAIGCFDAAYSEGMAERLAEAREADGFDPASAAGIFERRVSFVIPALELAREALTGDAQVAK